MRSPFQVPRSTIAIARLLDASTDESLNDMFRTNVEQRELSDIKTKLENATTKYTNLKKILRENVQIWMTQAWKPSSKQRSRRAAASAIPPARVASIDRQSDIIYNNVVDYVDNFRKYVDQKFISQGLIKGGTAAAPAAAAAAPAAAAAAPAAAAAAPTDIDILKHHIESMIKSSEQMQQEIIIIKGHIENSMPIAEIKKGNIFQRLRHRLNTIPISKFSIGKTVKSIFKGKKPEPKAGKKKKKRRRSKFKIKK